MCYDCEALKALFKELFNTRKGKEKDERLMRFGDKELHSEAFIANCPSQGMIALDSWVIPAFFEFQISTTGIGEYRS